MVLYPWFVQVTDIWTFKDGKVSADGTITTSAPVGPHGTAFFRLTKEPGL
jgi:hypothetical protein